MFLRPVNQCSYIKAIDKVLKTLFLNGGSYQQRLLLRRQQKHLYGQCHPHTTEDRKLFKKTWIHTSRYIINNTDGKEKTRKSQMGKSLGHWHIMLQWKQTYSTLNLKLTRLSHAMSNQSWVFAVTCIAWLGLRDFSHLKINTSQQLFLRLLTTRACRTTARPKDSFANGDQGLSTFNFTCSSPLSLVENSGRLTWVWHYSCKSSAAHFYQCVQYFHVSRPWYSWRCLGFLMCPHN